MLTRMTLPVGEFARRFLQHVLPRGFVRVRHYGLLSNRGREEKLRLCRRLLLAQPARQAAQVTAWEDRVQRCAVCGGEMAVVEVIPRGQQKPEARDTS